MDRQLWKFERSKVIGRKFGQPIDSENWFLSETGIDQKLLDKISLILQELLALLNKYNIDLLEDSEQECKGISFGNQYEVVWTTFDPAVFIILYKGFRVGKLFRIDTG